MEGDATQIGPWQGHNGFGLPHRKLSRWDRVMTLVV
jgi:hypothetical protein